MAKSSPPLISKTEVPLTDTLYNMAYNSLVGGPMHGLQAIGTISNLANDFKTNLLDTTLKLAGSGANAIIDKTS